jgi:predicted kinase
MIKITPEEKKSILEHHKKYGYKTINESDMDKKLFVLVGPPSVGKSTWIKSNVSNPYVISRDDIVESVAEEYGLTYDDLFASPKEDEIGSEHSVYGKVIESPKWMPFSKLSYQIIADANKEIMERFEQRVLNAKEHNNVIVDMTNMGVNPRKNILNKLKPIIPNHKKIAVVFNFKGGEDIIKQMAQRRSDEYKSVGKSKTIPPHVFDNMFKNYQDVKNEEGFDDIIYVDNIPSMIKTINK